MLTCTSARRLGDTVCGQEALFRYRGLAPKDWKKFAPVNLTLCIQCAYELMHDFGWQVKDRVVQLEPLSGMKYRIYCKSCFSQTIVQWDPQPAEPGLNMAGALCYCPRCG